MIDVALIIFPFLSLAVLLRRYDRLSADCLIGSIFAIVINYLHRFDIKLIESKILSPIKFCGIMCYSLYLVHWIVVKFISKMFALQGLQDGYFTLFVTIPVCVIFSVLVSWYFHLYVERRFLNSPITRTDPANQVEYSILKTQETIAVK